MGIYGPFVSMIQSTVVRPVGVIMGFDKSICGYEWVVSSLKRRGYKEGMSITVPLRTLSGVELARLARHRGSNGIRRACGVEFEG